MKTYLIFIFFSPLFLAAQRKDSLLNELHKAVSVAKNDTARMDAYKNLGEFYDPENRDSASYYLEKALPIAIQLNLKLDEAYMWYNLGAIQMQQEKFAKSLEFFLKGLNLAKDPKTENTIRDLSPDDNPQKVRLICLSSGYDLIGLLNAYTGNWVDNTKNQMINYRKAEKYAKEAGDARMIANINFHIGIAYMNEEKLDSAFILIKKAIESYSDLKQQAGMGRAMKYLGDTYQKMGDFDLAKKTVLQGIPYLKENNDYVHLGLAYSSLSRIYSDLDQNDSALHYARKSLKNYGKHAYPVGKKEAYNLLVSSFDRLGIADSATVYLNLAKNLSDSLSVEERKNLLAFQDVVLKEQAKLEELEKEKIESRGKLKMTLLMSGIIIFLAIVLLLFRNNRQRKKANILLQQQKEKVEKTLLELKSTQSQLIQSEKMASLGELTAGIAHEIQNPLNFVNNFSEVSAELVDEMNQEITNGNLENAKEIANDLKENLQKINHHGKRAGDIVQGMLQHSRKSEGKKELTDINALCDEYLRLAYHGLRAKDKRFNAKFETGFDESLPKINMVSQDIGRVILNLINNAFYAVSERKKKGEPNYEPRVTVNTKKEKNNVLIQVADNGAGIPQEIVDKIFQPFFTTKPAGEGTGLGLSLSYDIVKAHGGEIKVETKEGEGTEFIIQLPLSQ